MDFDGMRVFVTIADTGTLTGAAEKLGSTKSTISRRLAAYEHQLGVTLFRRSTRFISLTDIGRQHYDQVRELVHEAETAVNNIIDLRTEPTGLLRVSASIMGGQHLLAPLIWQFKKKHPKVRVELVITDEYVDLVRDGIDFTIRMGKLQDSDLLARRLGSGHRSIVASPQLLERYFVPQIPSDLKRLPAIVTKPDNNLWRFTNGEAISVNWELSTGTLSLALDACVQGFGIALIPDLYIKPYTYRGELTHLLAKQPLPSVDISLVYPKLQHQSPAARAFLALIRDAY
ncbi:LysR family transcriptional regulator [Motiliproteus coralliicola]|uniref:LysR family transcriptional regulator n=1 Tax=Motiliproteus coralliicola TaxID=2283196 RepID=A0A369WC12_9GAMM|nr:LysR family transcriptional regulator [Motiliproteus coralliicola]RDE18853.1 LysR family transcriptional regulator [Motiliproteus coralliicola]